MTTTISCVNLKGGVGKTALAVNLAAFFGSKGKKVLLIDLDPQTNATFSCVSIAKWQKISSENGSLADLIKTRSTNIDENSVGCSDVIIKNVFYNVDLIPSHLELFTIDLDIAGVAGREFILGNAVDEVKKEYDVIVCDCPPNLTIPTQNAIAMSNFYVVPVSPDFLSGIGIALLMKRVKKFCKDLRQKEVKCAGIVLSRVGRNSDFRSKAKKSLREQFNELVLQNELTERSIVAESAAKQKSIFKMGNLEAIREFNGVCQEIRNNIGL